MCDLEANIQEIQRRGPIYSEEQTTRNLRKPLTLCVLQTVHVPYFSCFRSLKQLDIQKVAPLQVLFKKEKDAPRLWPVCSDWHVASNWHFFSICAYPRMFCSTCLLILKFIRENLCVINATIAAHKWGFDFTNETLNSRFWLKIPVQVF